MKTHNKHKGMWFCWVLMSLMILACITSCSKMDDYKRFTENGEISYTGKVDSVEVYSGKSRVLIKGLFLADPKVVSCKILWNNGKDSVVVPVVRKNIVDSLSISIPITVEGVQNFTIYTYDNSGNRSIPVYKSGRVYADRYQSSLTNRDISEAKTDETTGITAVDFLDMDRLTGVFATDITFTDRQDVSKTIRVPIDSLQGVLANFKYGSTISYRTLFLPDTMSVDTFYSATNTRFIEAPILIKINITNTYLKNTGVPFTPVATTTRWGVLADWTTNAAVKNASGSNGGYELRANTGVMSLEAGWGLPDIVNGMIYQTITLPAGIYSFEANGIDQNTGGTRYLVVAEGTTLPNVTDIPSRAIGYTTIFMSETVKQTKLEFTLTHETQVSIGFAATMTGGNGSNGFYTKIGSVRLYSVEYL